jgi:hypothetical protein
MAPDGGCLSPARRPFPAIVETHRQKVVAVVDRVGDVPGQVRKAGLLRVGMALLGCVPIPTPDIRPVPVHHGAYHDGAARRGRRMNGRAIRAEYPMIGVAHLDVDTCFVRADNTRLAQPGHGIIATAGEPPLRPAQNVHQAALADRQPENIGKSTLQPLVGKSLKCLQIRRCRMDPGPNGVPIAASGISAATRIPHDGQRTASRRCRSTNGLMGGSSIVSCSLMRSAGRSAARAARQPGHSSGR